jgi:hypothetical protein
MLTKLIKHEFRATAKTFMWLYIAFMIIAAVNALFGHSGMAAYVSGAGADLASASQAPSPVGALLVIIYVLSIAAISIGTLVVIILRFYRNLMGNEGYLMMTLPVSREKNILSKLIVAVVWNICSSLLIIASIILIVGSGGFLNYIAEAISSLSAIGLPVGQMIATIILTMIVSTIAGILMLYAAMAIGPNLLKNRLGGSILAFIIIAVSSQFVSLGIMFGVVSASGSFAMQIPSVVSPEGIDSAALLQTVQGTMHNLTVGSLVSYGIIAVVCWFLTRYMLKKKLNLT